MVLACLSTASPLPPLHVLHVVVFPLGENLQGDVLALAEMYLVQAGFRHPMLHFFEELNSVGVRSFLCSVLEVVLDALYFRAASVFHVLTKDDGVEDKAFATPEVMVTLVAIVVLPLLLVPLCIILPLAVYVGGGASRILYCTPS